MDKPLLSFVLPTKNRIEWVGECLMSLLAQTEPNIEIVVIDDGSNDGTREFLDNWAVKDPRVTIVHHAKSIGAGPSRNEGTKIAKADIIAVCDDDDIYPDERAAITIEWFKNNPNSKLVNFPYIQVGYCNESIREFKGQEFDHEAFQKNGVVSYFSNPSCAYRKEDFEKMGGYVKEEKSATDDFQFIANWVKTGNKINFDKRYFLCYHRVLPDSMMVGMRGFDPKDAMK